MSKNSQKKGGGPAKPVLLGRLSTSLKVGILGLPNVGKSSFFNLMCKCSIPAENYPFCTIKPHLSKVAIPDERFDFLVDHWKPVSNVCGHLNVMDIAGLVKGASTGEGLGNNFLADIKGVDALFHMVRIFEDEDIVHVAGRIDPIEDIEIINEELRLKDLEYVQNTHKKLESEAIRGNDKSKRAAFDCFEKLLKYLTEDHKAVRFYSWTPGEIEILNEHLLLTAKPIIYLLNLSMKDFLKKKNSWLPKIVTWVNENDPGAQIIPLSVDFETKALDSGDEELNKQSSIPKIIKTGFKVLNLKYFFTAGKDEVKAWIIQEGYKAPKAAGRIHTDIEKGFIAAEVMAFKDFKEQGSEANCKAAGKYMLKGRDYEVQDGDIIFFKFNTPTTKKK